MVDPFRIEDGNGVWIVGIFWLKNELHLPTGLGDRFDEVAPRVRRHRERSPAVVERDSHDLHLAVSCVEQA